MKTNNILLIIASVLLLLGLIPSIIPKTNNVCDVATINVTTPSDPELKNSTVDVTKILQSGSKSDALRLASLYLDISKIIALDNENSVIKNTDEIREANKLSGMLCFLNLKDKYDGLAEAANKVIVTGIGDDNVPLDSSLREKAVKSFEALAWACKEGSK